jgi:hypothetical protein
MFGSASIELLQGMKDRRHKVTFAQTVKAIVTDSHFLIPVVVLCLGCALLLKLY